MKRFKLEYFLAAAICALILLVISSSAAAGTIYVKWDSPGPVFDGSSWETAYHTVQEGVNAAVSGDEVWVAAGTYVECITLNDGVALYGGFAGTETQRDQRDWKANETILDGEHKGNVVWVRNTTGPAARIDGFTIRNGGRGVYCARYSVVVTNNVITGNTQGGICCLGGYIANNIITGNTAEEYGGGIACPEYASHSALPSTIVNNLVSGNSARKGGGISCATGNCPVTVANNTVIGNTASEDGGGMYIGETYSLPVVNNIVAFNSSGICRGEGYCTPTLRNNCVYGNAAYDYKGLSPGTGDTPQDPKLASTSYGNAHIQADSPCVDAGDDSVVQADWLDVDGQPRVQGAHVDIGADESDGTTWTPGPYVIVRVSPSGDDANDGSSWAQAKRTVQAAIDTAYLQSGEVWAAAGTYYERITLRPYAHLYGGFAGTETERFQRNWATNLSILDGQTGGSVVTVPASHPPNTIDGFTIRNGGVTCQSARPTIANNTIYGGVYCVKSSTVLTNNLITRNTSGAVHLTGEALVLNNRIKENYGEALWVSGCSAVIAGNVITANGGTYTGGIRCGYLSTATIVNNTVVGNVCLTAGAIECNNCTSCTITNNIVAFNSSGISKAAGTGSMALRNNCVYGNTMYDYQGLSPGVGDILQDPKLGSTTYGNVHIQPDSPCVDTGDDSAVQADWLDMDGQLRIQGAHVDIGADEADGTTWPEGPYAVVRVKLVGDDANDGSSWALAKRTVQAAIDTAHARGGEVWVAAGTYYERIGLQPYVHLYGGFNGTESERDRRDWKANETILNGNGKKTVVGIGPGHRVNTVDGFTICDGYDGVGCTNSSPRISNNAIERHYTGVRCSSSLPIVTNNTIRHSTFGILAGSSLSLIANNVISENGYSFYVHGGGIYCSGGSATIANNLISESIGKGIYCDRSSVTIADNTIRGNAAMNGAGITLDGLCSATITNNVITENTAEQWGGGIRIWTMNSATITNNTIVGNSASLDGGGIYCLSTANISNNVVAFNSSGMCCYGGDQAFDNNEVYGNAAYNYKGLPDPTGTNGNISEDPLFLDLAGGDYRLRFDSPCVDAGTNEGAPPTDILGNPRPLDGDWDGIPVTDIGAYEYVPLRLQIDVLPGDSTNIIRLQPNRMITVAILGEPDFDVHGIDPLSVVFGTSGATEVHGKGHLDDVNRDRIADMLFHFRCGDTGIQPGDTSVALYGSLTSGERFWGSDAITALGGKG